MSSRESDHMQRDFYLDLAAKGHRTPVGADLVLHEKSDPQTVKHHGEQLGAVIAEAAQRYGSPLAIPLMDLTVEKEAMLQALDVPEVEIDNYHFSEPPTDEQVKRIIETCNGRSTSRMQANCEASAHLRDNYPDLLPIGMSIGPFSLLVKLIEDPIMAVYFIGAGMSEEEEPGVAIARRCLEVGEQVILASIEAQIEAGAKAMFICEPAANVVYLSPHQWDTGVFDTFVMQPNQRLRQRLRELDCDLIFHDCGELTDDMIREFVKLDPALMSLGSSRNLWEDASLVPETTVLYGNLPSKQFYSDSQMPLDEVKRQTLELAEKMTTTGQPFILGTECDVLAVEGSEQSIKQKVQAMLTC